MSVVLSWETPAELYSLELMAYRIRVIRTLFQDSRPSLPVVLTESATWGVYEDLEVGDPADARYQVEYLKKDGGSVRILDWTEIRTWARPGFSARINICCTRPDSSPWVGRNLKFSNLPTESFNRDLYTNIDGDAMAIFSWDWRMRMTMEGWPRAFEFTVPRVREISLPRLMRFGSWVDLP